MTHREISAYDGMSVPTVRRGIEDLCRYGLLIKDATINGQGQQANSYRIVWSNLDAIANGESLDEPAPVPEKSSQVVKVGGDHHEHPPDHSDQAILYPPFKPINTHPPSNQALVTSSSVWLVVEEDLKTFGLGQPVQAAEIARDRGYSPAEVQQLLKYANSKPGAYGPGAVFTRIRNAIPGDDPTGGWPEENKNYRKQKQRHEAKSKADQGEREAAEREARRERDQRARQELEREFGPQLDQMDRYERRDLADNFCGDLVARKLARDPDAYQSSGFYRTTLLEAMQRQATGLPGISKSTVAEGSAIADRN